MKGGALCGRGDFESIFPVGGEDIYTFGEELSSSEGEILSENVFTDKNDDTKIIKVFHEDSTRSRNEYTILQKLEHTGFTPRLYGVYKCNNKIYVVMDRINGVDLSFLRDAYVKKEKRIDPKKTKVFIETEFINIYISEIYEKYNILMDLGIIPKDLYLQNIMLGEDNQIYFIDFEYSIDVGENIPTEYRLTIEQLIQNLLKRKGVYTYDLYLTAARGEKRKNISKRKKSHKRKQTRRNQKFLR
jgi:serine/threonine protein kinase